MKMAIALLAAGLTLFAACGVESLIQNIKRRRRNKRRIERRIAEIAREYQK